MGPARERAERANGGKRGRHRRSREEKGKGKGSRKIRGGEEEGWGRKLQIGTFGDGAAQVSRPDLGQQRALQPPAVLVRALQHHIGGKHARKRGIGSAGSVYWAEKEGSMLG